MAKEQLIGQCLAHRVLDEPLYRPGLDPDGTQMRDRIPVVRLAQEGRDAADDFRPDAIKRHRQGSFTPTATALILLERRRLLFQQCSPIGCQEAFQIPKGPCQHSGSLFPYRTDAQCEQEALERRVARSVDGSQQVGRGLLATSMAFLPMSHIFERMWTYLCMSNNVKVYLNQHPSDIQTAIKEVHPCYMCAVPRFWEKVFIGVRQKIDEYSPFRKALITWAIAVGKICRGPAGRVPYSYIRKGDESDELIRNWRLGIGNSSSDHPD